MVKEPAGLKSTTFLDEFLVVPSIVPAFVKSAMDILDTSKRNTAKSFSRPCSFFSSRIINQPLKTLNSMPNTKTKSVRRNSQNGSKKQLEKEIQLSILDYLAFRQNSGKFMFWRQNTVPVFDKGHYRPMPKHSKNGVPDIILVRYGVFIGLEVKRPGGKLSVSQEAFKQELERAGGQYYVVTSIDDVQKLGL